MQHRAIGSEFAAVTWAMKALIALKMRDRATQVCADRTCHGKPLVPIAKYKDLFVRQKCRRAKRKVSGVTDFEGLWRLIKDAWHQEPAHTAPKLTATAEQSAARPTVPQLRNARRFILKLPYSKTSRSCCSRASMVMAWVGQRWAQRPQRMHFSSFLIMAPAWPALSSTAGTP